MGYSPGFVAAIPFTLHEEGGFSDNEHDPGAATNHGITRATLARWRGKPVSVDDVRNLTVEEAQSIYNAWYWAPVAGDQLPAGVGLSVFDMGVTSGDSTSETMLQRLLGVTADGHIGPITLAAAALHDASVLVRGLAAMQEAYYRSLHNFQYFGKGWLARTGRRRDTALAQIAALAAQPAAPAPAAAPAPSVTTALTGIVSPSLLTTPVLMNATEMHP